LCGGKTKRFGYHPSGKRRYRCLVCLKTFIRTRQDLLKYTDFQEFHRYITDKHNREGGVEYQGYSLRTLARRIVPFLDQPLTASDIWNIVPPTTSRTTTPWVHGCDGKWLGRVGVFFIHRNVTTKENLWWSFMKSESYESIQRDLEYLTGLLGSHLPVGSCE
jgi:hypothetical protein